MLSCICLGIGEALIIAAIAGSTGLGVHAATCKPAAAAAGDSTCCNHVHVEPEPAPRRSGMERATRAAGWITLGLVAVFVTLTCAGELSRPHRHDPSLGDTTGTPCSDHHNGDHAHEHGHEHHV